jgi:hypothetical protein
MNPGRFNARLDLDESGDDAHEQTRGPLVASPRAFALWAAALTVIAELSPRTFCTFAREFSPLMARGCS